jgi:von Willebrand factor A domain-containing protein 7
MDNRISRILILIASSLLVGFGYLNCLARAGQQDGQNPSRNLSPCERPVDANYLKLAEESGGQVMMLDKSEMAQSADLLMASYSYPDAVLRAGGKIDDEIREFSFPIDATIKRLSFTIFVQCTPAITVLRADGSEVTAGEAGVTGNLYQAGRLLTVMKPMAGEWRVRLAGRGLFSVVVRAESEIKMSDLTFIKKRRGANQQDEVTPINNSPRAGTEQLISVRLTGELKTSLFKIVNGEGNLLKTVQLTKVSGAQGSALYSGSLILPNEPFRFLVTGETTSGLRYQRYHQPLIRPLGSQ